MRVLIRLCLALVMLGLCGRAGSAAFPDRAIHIVVPFPPGGPADVVARIVGPRLGERLGQSVVIDSIAGDQQSLEMSQSGHSILRAAAKQRLAGIATVAVQPLVTLRAENPDDRV